MAKSAKRAMRLSNPVLCHSLVLRHNKDTKPIAGLRLSAEFTVIGGDICGYLLGEDNVAK